MSYIIPCPDCAWCLVSDNPEDRIEHNGPDDHTFIPDTRPPTTEETEQ